MSISPRDTQLFSLFGRLRRQGASLDDAAVLDVLAALGDSSSRSRKSLLAELQKQGLGNADRIALVLDGLTCNEKADLKALLAQTEVPLSPGARGLLQELARAVEPPTSDPGAPGQPVDTFEGGDSRPPVVLVVDNSAARGETDLYVRQMLTGRREGLGAMIRGYESDISVLETDLKAIRGRIAEKTREARGLLDESSRLLREIEQKKGMATAAGGYGLLLGLLTFGASAAVGAGVAASAAAAISSLQSQLEGVRRRQSAVAAELASLDAAAAAFERQQAQLGSQLSGLRTAKALLDTQALPTDAASSLDSLRAAVRHDEAVVENLEAQIALLQAMRKSAAGFETHLDVLIAGLRQRVGGLKAELKQCNEALVVAALDLALTGFGADAAIRAAGLTLTKKQLLVAAVDLAAGDLRQATTALVDGMVKNGVVAATGSRTLAAALATVLRSGSGAGNGTAVSAILSSPTLVLSDVQRGLLAALGQETRYDVAPLALAIASDTELDAARAASLRAMLVLPEPTPG